MRRRTCDGCEHWFDTVTEDDGHTHQLGYTRHVDGTEEDHGYCAFHGRSTTAFKTCEYFNGFDRTLYLRLCAIDTD